NLLRNRLTRRGLTFSCTLFATALGDSSLRAALPAWFIVSSAKAVMAVTTGSPNAQTVSADVLTLTSEVIRAMFLTKVKMTAAVGFAACALVMATVGGLAPMGAAENAQGVLTSAKATSGKDTKSRSASNHGAADEKDSRSLAMHMADDEPKKR